MRIERLNTTEGHDLYATLTFHRIDIELPSPDGKTDKHLTNIEVPIDWPYAAIQALAGQGLRPSGIPQRLKPVMEDGVPVWLARHVADSAAMQHLPAAARLGGESSFRQVFDRLAGGWTHAGWKAGYFSSEEDAQAFFDEIRYLLVARLFTPDAAQWARTGLDWAYGLEGAPVEGVWIEPVTGLIRQGTHAHLHPDIAVVLRDMKIEDEDSNASLMHTVRRIDRRAALRPNSAPVPVAVDFAHPESEALLRWYDEGHLQMAALATGARQIGPHLDAIHAAAQAANEPNLSRALRMARQQGVPETLIERATDPAAPPMGMNWDDMTAQCGGRHVMPVLSVDDTTMNAMRDDTNANRRWTHVVSALRAHGKPELTFGTTTESWHGCTTSGPATATDRERTMLFMGNVAATRGTLNLPGFRLEDGGFDRLGFERAVRLATIALDISLSIARYPTVPVAQRTAEFRPISLGHTDLATLLLGMAVPYDSAAGRALAAAITAVMTGAAMVTSSELAARLGACEGLADNRENVLRVVRNHRRAVYGETGGYENLAMAPQTLDAEETPDPALVVAARHYWDKVLELGHTYGFRNAHVTGLGADATARDRLGAQVAGLAPLPALTLYQQSGAEDFTRAIHPLVFEALAQLGYDGHEQRALADHLRGRLSLRDAPAVTHAALRAHGFGDAQIEAIEQALPEGGDVRQAFTPWVLGRDFCAMRLGLDEDQIEDPAYDILARLGFDAEDIAAANAWCYGATSLTTTPDLRPEHVAVFAVGQEVPPQAVLRMAGAVQSFVTGNVAVRIDVPRATSTAEISALLTEAWQLGLKSAAILREGAGLGIPLAETRAETSLAPMPATTSLALDADYRNELSQRPRTFRERLPNRRKGYTQKAIIGGHKAYLRTGEYEDGRLGEIFIDMHKEGASFRSLINNFAIAVSMGLQYGVPLEEFVDAFTFTRFEPAGAVEGNEAIRMATSVLDYVFRELAVSYLGRDDLAHAQPQDLRPDSLGGGHREGDLPSDTAALGKDALAAMRRVASRGYMRGNLRVFSGSGQGAHLKVRLSENGNAGEQVN